MAALLLGWGLRLLGQLQMYAHHLQHLLVPGDLTCTQL